jgi:hypothetical protein
MRKRRSDGPEVRDLALARLAALRPREGWVPRVPDAGSTALAGRTDGPGPAESPVAAVEPGSGPPWPDETWPAADAWFGPLSTTSDPPGDPPGDPTGDAGRDGDASGPTGRHGADALADRIPLAVRTSLAASVPGSAARVGWGSAPGRPW